MEGLYGEFVTVIKKIDKLEEEGTKQIHFLYPQKKGKDRYEKLSLN